MAIRAEKNPRASSLDVFREQEYRRQLAQSKRLPRLFGRGQSNLQREADESLKGDQGFDQEESVEEDQTNLFATEDEFGDQEAEDEMAEQDDEDQYNLEQEETSRGQSLLSAQAKAKEAQLAKDKLRQELLKKLAGRLSTIKIGSAITLEGIIITYLVWTAQFIMANVLGNPNIPKLALWEIVLWGLLSALIMLAILLIIVVIVLILFSVMGAADAVKTFGSEIIDLVF